MRANQSAVGLLLWIAFVAASCATAPPAASLDPVVVLPGVWEGRLPRWNTPPRLVVSRVTTPKGPDQWVGSGRFGGSPISLDITRLNGTIRVTGKNEVGFGLVLDLFGERRLVGTLYPPTDASRTVELMLEKKSRQRLAALTLDQLKGFTEYADAKAALIGTWQGSVDGIDDNKRVLSITIVDEVEGDVRIVAFCGIPGRGVASIPVQFVQAKDRLALYFITRAEVDVTLWMDARKGTLDGTFAPLAAGVVYKIHLVKD